MIDFQNVKKRYGKQVVLNELSINLGLGQVVALIGPNGSGKTTLIKSLLGLVLIDEGEILFEGQSVKKQSHYRSYIGYMPQINRYPEYMTVKQLFAFMKGIRKDVLPEDYDWELYNDFKIEKMSKKPLNALSGGMKQKVSAALAFLFNPKVLLLDEPTAGLDPIANEIFKQKLIKTAAANKLIVITSHILSDLEDLVNHVIYLLDGNLSFYESIEELKAKTKTDRLSKMIAERLKAQN